MNENTNPVSPTQVLVFGIVSLATSSTVIVGIIFGILAMNKAKAYFAAGGEASGKVKTGKILGTVGLILSIVMVIFWIIYIAAIATVVSAYGGMY